MGNKSKCYGKQKYMLWEAKINVEKENILRETKVHVMGNKN